MSNPIPIKAATQPIEAAQAALIIDELIQAPHIDMHRERRAAPRDAAIVLALHTTLHEAVHVHDPIDPHEADRLFAFAVKGLTDQLLLPILTSGQHVLEGGDLTFQRDVEPVAPGSDRHASKLIRKRIKRRKQSYAAAMKTSTHGSYAASRTSSRAESRLGGSRFGGSRASASVRLASRVHRMSLAFGLSSGGESMLDSSWIDSQPGPTGTTNNNASWLHGEILNTKGFSPPSSVTGTARVAVDFVELQRRADIERDLSTRESVRRSNDEFHRKSDLRLKLRSLADPTVSLEEEEVLMAAAGEKGQRSRFQQSRQGTRGKTPGLPQTILSPVDGGTRQVKPSTLATDEAETFRTEDYEGLTSDVVLFGKGGELLVSENCFVVEQKLRQELLLDLHTRGVVHPRIQVAKSKPHEENTSGENMPQYQARSTPSPLQRPKKGFVPSASIFGAQIGSFASSPSLALDLQATPLAKGVVLKLPDAPAARAQESKTRNAPRKTSTKMPIPESLRNAKLETELSALLKAPDVGKHTLAASQSDSVLQTQKALLRDAPPLLSVPSTQSPIMTKPPPSAGSPVLPKHIHSGEKHLQNLRIRTPAYPNRLSRKTPSRSNIIVDGDEYGWSTEGPENLFSLQPTLTSSLPNVKYVREFPNPPQGRIQLFGTITQESDWKLSSSSPFSFPSRTTTAQDKR
ncbi:hypothetical protein PHYPSEUDO_011160 [Phytophthora pseudosyringae]|uniref:Uncharacterized protein n=1 Tax=Phytophthora pseudosyringae TaxID=221518 RepID=A0A8T1V8P4_9STRA|nr:hypothetical protein PHYPSEUDO_011160 [Phytophthora pseudosyringae]